MNTKKPNKYWSKLYTLPSFWLGFFLSIISDYGEGNYFHWDIWNMVKDELSRPRQYHNPLNMYLQTCGALIVIEMIVYYFTEKSLEAKTLAYTKENPYGDKK